MIIISLIILLIASAATGAVWYRYRQKQKAIEAELLRKKQEEDKKRQVEEELNKAVSYGYAVISKAVGAKNLDDCLRLEGEVKDNCFYAVAQALSDKAACDRITEEKKKSLCQESLTLLKGEKDISKEFCSAFKIPDISQDCYDRIFSKFTDPKSCQDFSGVQLQRCSDLVNSAQAVKGDGQTCDTIKDSSIKDGCKVAVANVPKDSDGDGIPDTLEISYGTDPLKADTDGDGLKDGDEIIKYYTDPLKADTDGDGHSDGEEVKGGFNPKGDGKLK